MGGLLGAGALLLLAAGLPKLAHPHASRTALSAARLPGGRFSRSAALVRFSGGLEVAVALLVLLVGGRVAAVATAVTFLALAGFAARLLAVAPGADCGCFGGAGAPASRWHVAANCSLALAAAAAVVRPPGSLVGELAGSPALGLPLALTTALLAVGLYLVMTALPVLTAGPAPAGAR